VQPPRELGAHGDRRVVARVTCDALDRVVRGLEQPPIEAEPFTLQPFAGREPRRLPEIAA
jgi:hypothetical protein